MVVFDLDTLQLNELQRKAIDKFDGDFSALLRRFGEAAEDFWTEKFRAEGPGWEPLAPSTLERRRKDGEGAQILRDDGILFQSLSRATGRGENSVYKLSPTQLSIGTNVPYAPYHQLGVAKIRAKRDGGTWMQVIPARPFLPEGEELTELADSVLPRWLKQVLGD